MQLNLRNLSFRYPGSPDEVLSSVSLTFSDGWTGIAGANGAGKTTLLLLATHFLKPDSGTVDKNESVLYCPQRTDESPSGLTMFLDSLDHESFRLAGLLGIDKDWPLRWSTLSHGERKRAQIAVALWKNPDILAVDEPANHIDVDARLLLIRGLETYSGIGLIVSHDRSMIDHLCQSCVFIDKQQVRSYTGGYTSAVKQREMELIKKKNLREKVKTEVQKARQIVHSRRIVMDSKKKCISKKGIRWSDHDARRKIDIARITGKDTGAARRMKTAASRVKSAEKKLSEIHVQKERKLSFWMEDSKSERNSLLDLPSGSLSLGDRTIEYPSLSVAPSDRIAITGKNGSGKSTLIRHIVANLIITSEEYLYIPQELGDVSDQLLSKMKNLSKDELGRVMSIISCLGSDPGALIDSKLPSPGEMRKLMLALAVSRSPFLLIMDEPTNHLDLPSIELLEDALNEFHGAMILVSHDRQFLDNLSNIYWDIRDGLLRTRLRK